MASIYIVLTQTGTLFARAIRRCTGDPYNHSSVAFDGDLHRMFSFGRKKRYNMLCCGLIEEGFDRGIFRYFPQTRCCVLEIPVSNAEYVAMESLVDRFWRKREDYRYNLLGVFGNWIGVGYSRPDHYFCSQFVSFVLGETNFWEKDPKLTRPMDFLSISGAKIVFEGGILDFNKKMPHAVSIA